MLSSLDLVINGNLVMSKLNKIMQSGIILEACVENLQQAILAEKLGASRVELCVGLVDDGLTPPKHLIQEVVSRLSIPVRIMIRPRSGGFVYTDLELEKMRTSIRYVKEIGADGVVFGVLNENNEMDVKVIEELVALSQPLGVTIHKAFDCTEDPIAEIRKLEQIKGVDTILTSGNSATAMEGLALLKEMTANVKRIQIMACGRVTNENVSELHVEIQTTAYHGTKIVGPLT